MWWIRLGDRPLAPRLPSLVWGRCAPGGGPCAPLSARPSPRVSDASDCWCSLRLKRRALHACHFAFSHVTSARHWRRSSTVAHRAISAPHFVQDHARLHWPCPFRTPRNQFLMSSGFREPNACMAHPRALKMAKSTVSSPQSLPRRCCGASASFELQRHCLGVDLSSSTVMFSAARQLRSAPPSSFVMLGAHFLSPHSTRWLRIWEDLSPGSSAMSSRLTWLMSILH